MHTLRRGRFWVAVFGVGILGGLVGVLFHTVLSFLLYSLYDGNVLESLANMPWWVVVLLPAVGGLCAGALIQVTKTPEVYGEGVPAIHRALEDHASHIRYRVFFVKFFATVATILSGGSAGREGPVIHMGGALGSGLAQITKQSPFDRETLLLAGTASAMTATFGTPAAAIVFVAEVLRRTMTFGRSLAIILAVIIASVVSVSVFDYHGLVLSGAVVETFSVSLFLVSLVVGVVAGVVAVVFGVTLRGVRTGFARLPIPVWTRPACGGLLVGVLLVFLPQLHEAAFYQLSLDAFVGLELSWLFILVLLVAKIIATSATVGSGGSGGIFAPSLFIGLLVGMFANSILTLFGAAYTTALLVVGMTAVFAAAAHAPFTAVFLLYEMTESVTILPYLGAGAMTGYLSARALSQLHMYSRDNL